MPIPGGDKGPLSESRIQAVKNCKKFAHRFKEGIFCEMFNFAFKTEKED